MWPFYTWIFIVLDDNLLVGTFASEVYGPCKHLPWIRLFESKVFIYTRVITRASLWYKIYYSSLIINERFIIRALLPY